MAERKILKEVQDTRFSKYNGRPIISKKNICLNRSNLDSLEICKRRSLEILQPQHRIHCVIYNTRKIQFTIRM